MRYAVVSSCSPISSRQFLTALVLDVFIELTWCHGFFFMHHVQRLDKNDAGIIHFILLCDFLGLERIDNVLIELVVSPKPSYYV